jgi:endonuclease/exonuclease/phosphatase family metal-dependent hydrolase
MKLKVISLNIWESNFLDQAIGFFKTENADLILLQEAYGLNDQANDDRFRTLEVLSETLGFTNFDYVPGLRHNRKEGRFLQGNAVLSKFPILKREAVFFNDPFNDNFTEGPEYNAMFPHVLQHVVLDVPTGEINVFNLHGTWDLDGDNFSEKRQQMSQAIIEAVKGKSRVILAGDTNAKPTNKALRNVEEYLNSVFGEELKTTFNMKHKDNPGYATAAVDMMFISPDIKVSEKACPEVDVSDHLPLVVQLLV